jgi:glycosyltransferase involved in cell wall biosynthesis
VNLAGDPTIVIIGGVARSLTNFRKPLLEALQQQGFIVSTMAGDPDPETTKQLLQLEIPFTEVTLNRTSLNPLIDLRTIKTICSTLRPNSPTFALAYTAKPVIFGLFAARLAGVPYRIALITGLGFGLTGESIRRRILSRAVRSLYRLSLTGSKLVFFQNPDDELLFRQKVLRQDTRTVIVRGSGVDSKHFSPVELPSEAPFKFLFIGRFLVEKGLRDLVEATRILRNLQGTRFEVHLVGWIDTNPAGITDAELSSWIADGLVVDHGPVDDVRPFIASSHALVLPSYREGTPRSVLEAMAMQRAVITTDVPGCREPVVHHQTGLIVPVQDPTALAAAMELLLHDPELVDRFGRAGRARIHELYEASTVAKGMVAEILETYSLGLDK